MGLAYANPPFSLLAKVLTKITYEGRRVVICTPDWGCSGEHAYWRRMQDRMTVGRVQLPDGPIYVPEDSDTAMQAPEWASFLSIVDGSLNPVPLCHATPSELHASSSFFLLHVPPHPPLSPLRHAYSWASQKTKSPRHKE